jgi:hypothetical protein
MDIQHAAELQNLPISIQCSWANAFTTPDWVRANCIRSYDAKLLHRFRAVDRNIGKLTGNFFQNGSVIWLEASLKFSDRRPSGWFRESDINHALKGLETSDKPQTSNTSGIIRWIVTGISILSLLK